jgi:hypothetical protein
VEGGDPALHMDGQGAGREEPRSDGNAERVGGGIAGEDGPGHGPYLPDRRDSPQVR